MSNQTLAIYNLAYTYAKAIVRRRKSAVNLTPKELNASARRRVNPSLLALARINLNRKSATHSAPKAIQ